jgi:hypothetical protein
VDRIFSEKPPSPALAFGLLILTVLLKGENTSQEWVSSCSRVVYAPVEGEGQSKAEKVLLRSVKMVIRLNKALF